MIAIIDLDSVAFSIGHPNKVLDKNGEPIRKDNKFVYEDKTEIQLIESGADIMKSILSKGKFTGYIGFIKGKGNYRYSINSEYKQNRPIESPKWWSFVKDYLIQQWKAIEVNGIEVDDAVNITRLIIPDSIIVAIDKDLLELEGLHYNWRKDEWVTTSKARAEYKFWSDMIVGQPADNIKGIPGSGIKAAEKIMEGIKCPPARILKYYIEHFGEKEGINQFYKNYNSLLILDSYKDFIIPDIIDIRDRNFEKEKLVTE